MLENTNYFDQLFVFSAISYFPSLINCSVVFTFTNFCEEKSLSSDQTKSAFIYGIINYFNKN